MLMTTAIRVGLDGNVSEVTARVDEVAWNMSAIRPATQCDGVHALRSCDQRRCSSSDPSAIRDLRRASRV